MGVETAVIATIISAGVAVDASEKQQSANRKAARATREANAQQSALEEVSQADRVRQQVREARLRQGQITQSAVNTGTSGSSSQLGTASNLSYQLTSNLASGSEQTNTAQGLSVQNQRAADARSEAALQGQILDLAVGIGTFSAGQI